MVRLIPILAFITFTALIAPAIILGYLAIFGYSVSETQINGAVVLFAGGITFGLVCSVWRELS